MQGFVVTLRFGLKLDACGETVVGAPIFHTRNKEINESMHHEIMSTFDLQGFYQ